MLPELVLAGSLLLLGLTNLLFAVLPWVVNADPGSIDTWAPIGGRLLGAAGLALGALLPATPVRRPRRAAVHALGIVLAALLAIGLAAAALASHLPVGIDPDLRPDPSGPDLVGGPSVLATQIVSLVLYATGSPLCAFCENPGPKRSGIERSQTAWAIAERAACHHPFPHAR